MTTTGNRLLKGLLAGLTGTAVMTVAQMVEMKATGRKPSKTPARAVEKVLKVSPAGERKEGLLANAVHWHYGTLWGLARALLGQAGLRGGKASALHFAAVWGTALVMLPSLRLAPPITRWSRKQIVSDVVLHAIYAATTGVAFDLLSRPKRPRYSYAWRRLAW